MSMLVFELPEEYRVLLGDDFGQLSSNSSLFLVRHRIQVHVTAHEAFEEGHTSFT